jgi:hypothetical protein
MKEESKGRHHPPAQSQLVAYEGLLVTSVPVRWFGLGFLALMNGQELVALVSPEEPLSTGRNYLPYHSDDEKAIAQLVQEELRTAEGTTPLVCAHNNLVQWAITKYKANSVVEIDWNNNKLIVLMNGTEMVAVLCPGDACPDVNYLESILSLVDAEEVKALALEQLAARNILRVRPEAVSPKDEGATISAWIGRMFRSWFEKTFESSKLRLKTLFSWTHRFVLNKRPQLGRNNSMPLAVRVVQQPVPSAHATTAAREYGSKAEEVPSIGDLWMRRFGLTRRPPGNHKNDYLPLAVRVVQQPVPPADVKAAACEPVSQAEEEPSTDGSKDNNSPRHHWDVARRVWPKVCYCDSVSRSCAHYHSGDAAYEIEDDYIVELMTHNGYPRGAGTVTSDEPFPDPTPPAFSIYKHEEFVGYYIAYSEGQADALLNSGLATTLLWSFHGGWTAAGERLCISSTHKTPINLLPGEVGQQ